jgi:4,4'-diaponeurosporenoate glycosyltransferase
VLTTAYVVAVELLDVERDAPGLAIYAIGWALGWLLLWTPSRLPTAAPGDARRPVAVVIPARNEAHSLPHLLRPLVDQRRHGDEIVVVDDDSQDGTARVARLFGVDVIDPPVPPPGWLGKPNACWHGVAATDAPVLVFLDADARPGPTLLDDLAAEVERHTDAVVSMQPWHEMRTLGEQSSILFNVTALMGCGAFTIIRRRSATTVAFGPVIAIDRATYLAAGGHAEPAVRSMHTEDIGLARAVGRSRLFVGSSETTTFRMYPSGLGELTRGWTRSIASGARYVPWWLTIATACWIWSLAGGWIATPIVYPLSALQVYVLGKRAGTISPIAAALFPILVIVFAGIFLRSILTMLLGGHVSWKGRRVAARGS